MDFKMEIAMIGYPQSSVDLVLAEFRRYVRSVQSEMAARAEEIMAAKHNNFVSI